MEGLNLTPILIGLGALLAGWLIGFFDSNNRTAKKIRQAEQRAEAAEQRAEVRLGEAGSGEARAVPAAAEDAGLLRLKQEGGRPVLDLDGERVEQSRLSQRQRKRLIELLTVIRPWLETAPAGGRAVPADMPPPPIRTTISPARPQVLPLIEAPGKESPAAALTMVGQIDLILQSRLENTTLASRGIRLHESPEGGVIVQVGLKRYAGIDDVAEPQIREAIRAAIAEWELKFTPGI